MTQDEFNCFKSFRTLDIKAEDTRVVLQKFGPNMDLLLNWVDTEICKLKEGYVPITLDAKEIGEKFQPSWTKFLTNHEVDHNLKELEEQCKQLSVYFKNIVDDFENRHRMCDDDHSSYSDYSESDTTEESEEDDDEYSEEVSLADKPRQYFKRRR